MDSRRGFVGRERELPGRRAFARQEELDRRAYGARLIERPLVDDEPEVMPGRALGARVGAARVELADEAAEALRALGVRVGRGLEREAHVGGRLAHAADARREREVLPALDAVDERRLILGVDGYERALDRLSDIKRDGAVGANRGRHLVGAGSGGRGADHGERRRRCVCERPVFMR